MTMKYLIVLLTVLYLAYPNLSASPTSLCSSTSCNRRGECEILTETKTICKCYSQYYYGEKCEHITDECFQKEVRCIPHSTLECISYYGNYYCSCSQYYFGRFCENRGDGQKHVSFAGIYLNLEPTVDKNTKIFVVFKYKNNAKYIELFIERIRLIFTIDQFLKVDVQTLRKYISGEVSSMGSKEFIPQERFKSIAFRFLHPGKKSLVFRSVIIQETLRFTAEWSFLVNVQKSPKCSPDIRFTSGVASTNPSWRPTLVPNHLYKLTTSVSGACNESHELLTTYKHSIFNPDGSEFDLEQYTKGTEIEKIFKLNEFIPKYKYGYVYIIYGEVVELGESGSKLGIGREIGYVQYLTEIKPAVGFKGGILLVFEESDDVILNSQVILMDDIHKIYITEAIDDDFYLEYKWTLTSLDPFYIPGEFDSDGGATGLMSSIMNDIFATSDKINDALGDFYNFDVSAGIGELEKIPAVAAILDKLPGMPEWPSMSNIFNYIPSWSDFTVQNIINYTAHSSFVPSSLVSIANYTYNLGDKASNFVKAFVDPVVRDLFLKEILPGPIYAIYHDGPKAIKDMIYRQVIEGMGIVGKAADIAMGTYDMATGAVGTVTGYVGSAVGSVQSAIGSAGSAVSSLGSSAVGSVESAVGSVGSAVSSLGSSAVGSVESMFGFGGSSDYSQQPSADYGEYGSSYLGSAVGSVESAVGSLGSTATGLVGSAASGVYGTASDYMESAGGYVGSFFGKRRSMPFKKKDLFQYDDKEKQATFRWLTDWIPSYGDILGTRSVVQLYLFGTKSYDVFLQVCVVDKNKVEVKFCTHTQLKVIIYKSGTWNRPLINIDCMINCGEGVARPLIAVDRTEWIYLKVSCEARCIPLDQLIWEVFNNVVNLYSDFFADEGLPPGHKMINPAAMSFLIRDVTIYVKETATSESSAKFFYRYFSPPVRGSAFSNYTCPEKPQTKVVATQNDFSLCIDNIDANAPVSFMYFQTVIEVDLEIGMLFAYGQNPFLERALLAASRARSTIIYTVRNDFHGAEYLNVYPLEIEVYYPTSANVLELSTDLYFGKVPNRPSMKFSLLNEEWCEVTQKMHFILVQLTQVPLFENFDDQRYFERRKMDLMVIFLDDLRAHLTFHLVPEVLQITTLIYELIFINTLPLQLQLAMRIAMVLNQLSLQVIPLIQTDWEFREKPNRVLGVIRPMRACVSALLYSDTNRNLDILNDPTYKLTQIITENEIQVEDSEKFVENYRDYSEILNVFESGTKESWANRTNILLQTIYSLTYSMCLALDPKLLPEEIYWPSIQMHRKTGIAKNMYSYTKWGPSKYFLNPRHRIGIPDVVYIVFPTFENTTHEFCIEVSILPHIPYWWDPIARFAKPFAIFVHALDNYQDKEINATFYHVNLAETEHYVKGSSHKIGNRDDFFPCHVAVITNAQTPRIIIVDFKRPIASKLKVIVKAHKRPTQQDFYKVGNIHEIGGYTDKYAVQYKFTSKRKASFLYVAVQPMGNDEVNYELDVFIYSCSRLENETYSTAFCPNLTVLDRLLIACSCEVKGSRSIFISSYVPILNRIDGYMQVKFKFRMHYCRIVMITILLLLFIMGILFGFAFRLDLNESLQRPTIFLADNRPNEMYKYVVIIVTGVLRDSGTSSTIGIKIYGSLANSKRHVLLGVGSSYYIAKRSVKWYTLTTKNNLGKIRAVEVWTDYTGDRPNWFCEKVIIRNYLKMVEWVFMVHKWFSLYYGDHKIHRMLYQTKLSNKTILEKVINLEDFYNHHIWFGMLTREFCHALDRHFKVLSCTSIIFVAMFMAYLLLGLVDFDSDAILDEGNFQMNIILPKVIPSLILSILINYPFIWAYKNSNPVHNCPLTYNEFAGMDPKAPQYLYTLNYKFRHFCRLVFFIFILICASLMIYYGGYYGTRKSQMWLVATVEIIALDILIIETMHVILRAFCYRILLKKEEMQRFCNEIIDLTISEHTIKSNKDAKKMLIKKYMLNPVPKKFITAFALREKCYMQYRKVFIDTLLYMVYIILIASLFYFVEDYFGAYANHTMKKMIVEANYTKTTSLEGIFEYESFFRYLNDTLVFSTQWRDPVWMVMSNFQLLGIARLRQFRTIPSIENGCKNPIEFKFIQRKCLPEFSFDNYDTTDYYPFWMIEKTTRYPLLAFIYSPSRQNDFLNGLFFKVPDGGYIANLGRTEVNSRAILNVLKGYHWIDDNSRFIIVEFSSFNVHANLLTYVIIIIERSTTGVWLYDYQMYSFRLNREGEANISIAIFSLLTIFIIAIILEHIHILMTRGGSYYCKNLWNQLDLFILVISIITAYMMYKFGNILLQFHRVYEMSRKNVYFDTIPIVTMHNCLRLLCGLIVISCSMRIFRIFQIHASINRFSRAFKNAAVPIISVIILYIVFMTMLALVFYLIYGHSISEFRSFHSSFLSILLILHNINNDFSNEAIQHGGFFGICGFVFLLMSLKVYVGSFLISILVVQYRKTGIEYRPVKFKEFLVERILPKMGRDVIFELVNEKKRLRNI